MITQTFKVKNNYTLGFEQTEKGLKWHLYLKNLDFDFDIPKKGYLEWLKKPEKRCVLELPIGGRAAYLPIHEQVSDEFFNRFTIHEYHPDSELRNYDDVIAHLDKIGENQLDDSKTIIISEIINNSFGNTGELTMPDGQAYFELFEDRYQEVPTNLIKEGLKYTVGFDNILLKKDEVMWCFDAQISYYSEFSIEKTHEVTPTISPAVSMLYIETKNDSTPHSILTELDAAEIMKLQKIHGIEVLGLINPGETQKIIDNPQNLTQQGGLLLQLTATNKNEMQELTTHANNLIETLSKNPNLEYSFIKRTPAEIKELDLNTLGKTKEPLLDIIMPDVYRKLNTKPPQTHKKLTDTITDL